jgi:MFS superfamily sulfate permease-like transporter
MPDAPPTAALPRNRYDRHEWAGAFGDLGTLIPFVAAYIGVLGLDPFGVLFAFGLSMVVCGLAYRTPFPVQPMKAIGAVASIQAVQSAVVTPAAVYAAAFATGLLWLLMGLSGLMARLARWVPRVVVVGIVLGLGVGFMLQGVRMALGTSGQWGVAVVGAGLLLALRGQRRVPAMFVLLLFGVGVGAWQRPELLQQLAGFSPAPRLPAFALGGLSAQDLFVGVVLLALPQLPLTLGNAVIAVSAENNRLFPQRPVTEGRVATSTGLMNLFSGVVGGVPMCHGAGGMAAHVAFGARTGGSVVILGALLLVLALFFSHAVQTLFALFPPGVLGLILFVAGLQLALGSRPWPVSRGERAVLLVCAGLCLWNVALGFVVGLLLHALWRRRGGPAH